MYIPIFWEVWVFEGFCYSWKRGEGLVCVWFEGSVWEAVISSFLQMNYFPKIWVEDREDENLKCFR